MACDKRSDRACPETDLNILILGIVAPLLTTIIALLGKADGVGGILMAGFSMIGGITGIWLFTALGADGSITEISAGSSVIIASAANAQVWNFITMIPLGFALLAFMAAMYRGYQSF